MCCALEALLDDTTLLLHYSHRGTIYGNKSLGPEDVKQAQTAPYQGVRVRASEVFETKQYRHIRCEHNGADRNWAEPSWEFDNIPMNVEEKEAEGVLPEPSEQHAMLGTLMNQESSRPKKRPPRLTAELEGNSLHIIDSAGSRITIPATQFSMAGERKDLRTSRSTTSLAKVAALEASYAELLPPASEIGYSPLSILLDEQNDEVLTQALFIPEFDTSALSQQHHSTRSKHYGPQQIWLCIKNDYDGTEHPSGSSLALSIGSISPTYLDSYHKREESFCLNGDRFPNVEELTMRYPEIWRYKRRDLFDPNRREDQMLGVTYQLCLRQSPTRHPFTDYPSLSITDTDCPRQFWRELGHSWAAERFDWARSRLAECDHDHASCGNLKRTQPPTRLLQVHDPDLDPLMIKLVATQPSRDYRYAALSHCWGAKPEEVSKILTASLDGYMDGVPIASLSQNFQDAVSITKALGVQYLWIDALCILQDSKDDWAQEAALMGDYYAGAHLTISALGSPGAAHGITRHIGIPISSGFREKTGLPISFRRSFDDVRPLLATRSTFSGEERLPYVLNSR
ncbi:hypothetical protein LTR86_005486 [Recurvomyces mirabilis]|nr:hypothetical protein LTR86_005486 [Recurvomyces mirabilis]